MMPSRTSARKESKLNLDPLVMLSAGEIEIVGLVPWSSNYTYLVKVRLEEEETLAIYKPSRGERPLWDFPTGSLAKRECAAYLVSAVLGWPNIPPTVLRVGPEGEGALQIFIDAEAKQHFFTLREKHRGEMKKVAAFDAVINNTDRKGGHILLGKDGKVWCIDHGVTFHEYPKLRTVVWDFVGEEISAELVMDLKRLRNCLDRDEALKSELRSLLDRSEFFALKDRIDEIISAGMYPNPPEDWPHIPWPPV